MNCPVDILSLSRDELAELVIREGEPSYRASQLFSWLHEKRAESFSQMSNLGARFIASLSERAYIASASLLSEQRSADGTRKLLIGFADGNCVETVAMRYRHGLSLCVSSQAGCRMGCRFCASAERGLARNLTAGEMLLQVYEATRLLNERIDSVVIMGTGEPLDNYDATLRFVELVTDSGGYNLSNRSVSLSTCGLADRIRDLASERLGLTLSISLHAADDQTRSAIMPVNKRYPIAELLSACDYYFERTGRRISFEYAVIDGVNDSRKDAVRLAQLLKGRNAHVNLIPVNSGGDFAARGRAAADGFCKELVALELNATVRRTLGADIDAACGQLRNRYHEGKEQGE